MSYLNVATQPGLSADGCGCRACRASAGLGDPPRIADARVQELAKWPDRAHTAWKKLDAAKRKAVMDQMAANYGSDFAKQFLASVGKRDPRNIVEHQYGPEVGPTPADLKSKGYKFAQKDSLNEWWVHPTGERVMRNHTPRKKSPPPPPPPVRPRSAHCRDIDILSNSTCSNAEKICKIAGELNEPKSTATCERAKASCADSRQRSQACGAPPAGSGSGVSGGLYGSAWNASLGSFGQFQLLDAATCPPAGFTNAQATRVVRRAIAVAIGIAKSAAAKLDSIEQKRVSGQPRSEADKKVAKLFLFFFRHDPNHPIPWADNKPSGVNVAHRLRKAAEALVKRGIHYRCACPGAPADQRGQAVPGGVHIDLCNAFWTVPAGLHMDAETFRAGVILHEALHVIFDTINDAGAHRANDHCYEAFAMRASGHGADRTDVCQCRSDLGPPTCP